MSELTYPRPDNIKGRYGRWVTADMFHIGQRLQEIEGGDRLFIQHLDPPARIGDEVWNFVIVEVVNGAEFIVTRVRELDARVIEHCQYLLKVPFSQRLEEADKLERKRQQEDLDNELDKALESWGWDFRKQLAHDGFITHTSKSYPIAKSIKRRSEPSWRPAT